VDVATLAVLVVLEAAVTWFLLVIAAPSALGRITVAAFLGSVAIGLVLLVLQVYTFVILIYALMSFLNRGYNPIQTWLGQIAEPLLKPVRRAIPPISGLDLSPLIVLLLLQAARIALSSYYG
jgi:YggT family protein